MPARKLTLRCLKELLSFDETAGLFTWIKPTCLRIKPGTVAGCVDPDGYRRICIDGRYYKAARLAWFYQHGRWPTSLIDHKNGTSGGEAKGNIRPATPAQNAMNRRCGLKNKHGLKGVTYRAHLKLNPWLATICPNGKLTHIGHFPTAEAAARAYDAKAIELYGEFARLNFPIGAEP